MVKVRCCVQIQSKITVGVLEQQRVFELDLAFDADLCWLLKGEDSNVVYISFLIHRRYGHDQIRRDLPCDFRRFKR